MSGHTKSLITWLVLGIIGLSLYCLFFNHVFPVASIDIRLTKEEALNRAAEFVVGRGFDLKGFDKTVIFYSDYYASAYMQQTQGIKKSNELIREGIPVWFWRIRWFKELKKEGFVVDVDPSTGEIAHFHYSVLDDEKGANLVESQARAIAEDTVVFQGVGLKDYELKDSTTKKQKERTDYYFEWKKKDYKIKDATLRIRAEIYGDRLGRFKRYLKVPEGFFRYLRRESSFGTLLFMVTRILILLLSIGAVFLIISQKQAKFNWMFGLIFGCIVMPLKIFAFLNSMPLVWNFYPDTISKGVYIMMSLQDALISALSVGIMIFAYGTLGELFCRNFGQTKIHLFGAIKNKRIFTLGPLPIVIVGYSLGFIFLGYITLFYLIGTKFFNIWMPPNTEYSNILGMTIPFLFPLTFAASAAIREEFIFRLFAISFLKKCTRLTWLAILVSALIWGFAHSTYSVFPTYVRGIELTIFGIILGMVFLRYGLETVIIAHYVIDATLGAWPLLRSHNLSFIISGIIVITLASIPSLILLIVFKKEDKYGNFIKKGTPIKDGM